MADACLKLIDIARRIEQTLPADSPVISLYSQLRGRADSSATLGFLLYDYSVIARSCVLNRWTGTFPRRQIRL